MEQRKENWQHTLEFVRFKIPVDKILEEEEDDDDHVVRDETVTSSTAEVKEVATGSVEATEAVEEPGEIQRLAAKDASAFPAGEVVLESEPDHLELDYEPEDEDNNNGCVIVNQSSRRSSVQSNEVEDCYENMSSSIEDGAGDQEKEGGREKREKIDRAAFEGREEEEGMSQGVFCSHARGGCAETFSSMIELHDHARKCQFRPSSNFQCSTHGCGKRWCIDINNPGIHSNAIHLQTHIFLPEI